MRQSLSLRQLAAGVPDDRNRAVDVVRGFAILAVVVGHWLMAVVYVDADGEVHRRSLLAMASWTHPYTWAFQVVPLLFVVGGYANAISWRHAAARDTTYGGWLAHRLRRLLLPVVPLMVLWLVAPPLLLGAGLDPRVMRIADRAAMVPLWFLAAYVVVTALTPVTLGWWERFRWWSVVGGFVVAGAIDVLSIAGGLDPLGYVNPLVVWVTVHQLGYVWRDHAVGGTRHRLALAGGALLALVLLVDVGPYAVPMVGISGEGVDNTDPTRVTLALLGLAQAGLAMSAEPWCARLGSHARVWIATVAVNARVMTLYLWHLTAVGLVVLGIHLSGGRWFGGEPLTADWWLWRPFWLLGMALVTIALVACFGRFEATEHTVRPRRSAPVPILVALTAVVAIGLLAWRGVVTPDGDYQWLLPLGLLLVLALSGVLRAPEPAAGSGA